MYKALTRRPLQQAMVVLWLVGVVHLSGWLVDAAPTGKWVASAGMAAFLLMLIGARFRALAVIPVWVALGWAAAWGGAYVLGIDGASGIGFVTAVYAFAVWRTSVSLLASSKLVRVAGFLDLCGGYATPGGRFYVERIIYWSCFALTLLALVINSQRAPLAFGVLGVSWPVLAVALLYLFLGGWKYRLVLNTYLSVMLVVLAIISVFLALAGDVVLPLTDLIIGLITALGGFAFWSLGRSINGRTAVDSVVCSLYVTPLRNAALTMAVLSMLQVLVVAPGLPAAPEWHAVIILAVSSVVVLLANRELLLPVLTAVATASASCATVWFYSALVHSRPPFGLYPGSTISNGEWLVIALLTLTQAIAGLALYHRPTWRRAFGVPLLVLALLSFIWSLSGALSLYAAGSAHLPWIVAVLIAALFPLLRPTSQGQELRGVGVALLTSLLAAAILGPDGRATLGAQALLAWAFVLWFIGTLALPRLNASFPDWSVAPSIWPWLGLLALGMGVVHAYSPGILQWHLWVIVAAYLFLMLRHSAWSGFTWLTVGMLSVGIVLFSVDHYQPELASGELHAIGALALHNLVWANVLLALVPLWNRHGAQISERLSWREPQLRTPLLFTSFALCSAWLAAILLWDAELIVSGIGVTEERTVAGILAIVLSLSLLHALVRWTHRVSAHVFIAGVFATAISAWGITQPFSLPLAMGLFSPLFAAAWISTKHQETELTKRLHPALQAWLAVTPIAGLLLLIANRDLPIGEQLVTRGLLTGMASFVGWRRQSRAWLYGAMVFAALMLHEVWLIWFDWGQLGSLLPVYALQFALIALLLRWLSLNLQRPSAAESEAGFGPVLVRSLLPHFAWAALLLSVAEGAMHIVAVWDGLLSDIPMSLLAEPWGHAASITAMLLLTGLCILEVRPTRQDGWIYAAAALVAITGIYCRVLWIGLAPVGVWDTAAIIASGYMLFALEVVTKSRPMFILTVTLPLAALFTLPLQLESTHATLSLFALGALYLFTRLSTGMATPVYLAILAINAGIYLWVPGWADRFGLLQVYIIPAALTVLLLLHVHRHELQPNVLFGGRVTALSALYAAATLDVFLEEDLGIFMLVLMLSLAGIIIGIVTRTRAFLYAGTVFLVINVVGQLVQLYPEQRLGRALLLMAMGTAITAAMIGFNAKREAILRRIRIMRADLVTWN